MAATSEKQLVEEWLHSSYEESNTAGRLFKASLDLFFVIWETVRTLDGLGKGHKVALREELGRFFLWGKGFDTSQGELDDILSISSELRDTIMDLLGSVARLLSRRFTNLLYSIHPDDTLHSKSREVQKLLEAADGTAEGAGSNGYGEVEAPNTGDLGDSIKEALDDLQTYTSCLMDLVPSLERSADDVKSANARRATLKAFEFRVSAPAHAYVMMIRDRFPESAVRLAERFGEANWQRYERVRWIRRRFLAVGGEAGDRSIGRPDLQAVSVFHPNSTFHDSGIGTSYGQSPTYAPSHTSFVSSIADGDSGRARVPSTPEKALEGKPFRCNICCEVVENVRNRISWKLHVFADLRPYICTFQDCATALVTFSTRREWVNHEYLHRLGSIWPCNECREIFCQRGSWQKHLELRHSGSSAGGGGKSPQSCERWTCPFCSMTLNPTKGAFGTHVGRHMEEISLAALPRQLDNDSECEAHSLQQSEDSQLESDSEPETGPATPVITYYSQTETGQESRGGKGSKVDDKRKVEGLGGSHLPEDIDVDRGSRGDPPLEDRNITAQDVGRFSNSQTKRQHEADRKPAPLLPRDSWPVLGGQGFSRLPSQLGTQVGGGFRQGGKLERKIIDELADEKNKRREPPIRGHLVGSEWRPARLSPLPAQSLPPPYLAQLAEAAKRELTQESPLLKFGSSPVGATGKGSSFQFRSSSVEAIGEEPAQSLSSLCLVQLAQLAERESTQESPVPKFGSSSVGATGKGSPFQFRSSWVEAAEKESSLPPPPVKHPYWFNRTPPTAPKGKAAESHSFITHPQLFDRTPSTAPKGEAPDTPPLEPGD